MRVRQWKWKSDTRKLLCSAVQEFYLRRHQLRPTSRRSSNMVAARWALDLTLVTSISLFLTVALANENSETLGDRIACSVVPVARRYDCFPVAKGATRMPTEDRCVERGCCWEPRAVSRKENATKCYYPVGPRQVHLALTGNPDEMHVTWLDLGAANDSDAPGIVQYGTVSNRYIHNVSATGISYKQSPHMIYRATMTSLEHDTKYYYRVTNHDQVSSTENSFVSAPSRGHGPNEIILYGDMGYYDQGATTGKLIVECMQSMRAPLVLHVGDISYADFRGQKDEKKDNELWDLFFHRIESIANMAPYMVCAGNHDIDPSVDSGMQCGVGYIYRFKMPSQSDTPVSDTDCLSSYLTQVWYSFDYGLVHWTAISTEHDFSPGSAQYKWLDADLQVANEDRETVPFIILFGHRPMYCSHDHHDCASFASELRTMVEPLLVKYNVDIAIWGHIHAYERTYPVVNSTVVTQSTDNPHGPIHLIVGMAGADFVGAFTQSKPSWSAYRDQVFGYSRMHIVNRTAIKFEFITDTHGKIRDSFWLTKARQT